MLRAITSIDPLISADGNSYNFHVIWTVLVQGPKSNMVIFHLLVKPHNPTIPLTFQNFVSVGDGTEMELLYMLGEYLPLSPLSWAPEEMLTYMCTCHCGCCVFVK